MTFGLRCSEPARRPHPASLPVRVPTVEGLPPASFSFASQLRLAVRLRLPSSAPIGSFHPIRFCPCWAHSAPDPLVRLFRECSSLNVDEKHHSSGFQGSWEEQSCPPGAALGTFRCKNAAPASVMRGGPVYTVGGRQAKEVFRVQPSQRFPSDTISRRHAPRLPGFAGNGSSHGCAPR